MPRPATTASSSFVGTCAVGRETLVQRKGPIGVLVDMFYYNSRKNLSHSCSMSKHASGLNKFRGCLSNPERPPLNTTARRGPMAVSGITRRLKWVLPLLAPTLLAWAHSHPKENPVAKPEKITVTILAISTSTRQGFAGNEDIYLASFTGQQGASQLIRLADWTSSGSSGVPVMAIGQSFHLLATRTPWCDSNSRNFFLPVSAEERSQLLPTGTQGDFPLPCYRDQHESIRAVRDTPTDKKHGWLWFKH
jgi:hypothetical protein